jgi:hypothetical protein
MDMLSRIGIWISRVVIIGVSALFTWIGYRYIFNPVGNINETEVQLQTATAITAARVNFGAFPLVVAVLIGSSIFSLGQHLRGVATVVTMMIIVTVVRVYGIAVDGVTAHNVKLLYPEAVIIVLSVTGLLLELRRARIENKVKQ